MPDPSYNTSSPTIKDWFRLLIGDTDMGDVLFLDAEINMIFSSFTSDPRAALRQLLQSAYSRACQRQDVIEEVVREEWKMKAAGFKQLLDDVSSIAVPTSFGGSGTSPAQQAPMLLPNLCELKTD